jgi:hypothetical protein
MSGKRLSGDGKSDFLRRQQNEKTKKVGNRGARMEKQRSNLWKEGAVILLFKRTQQARRTGKQTKEEREKQKTNNFPTILVV